MSIALNIVVNCAARKRSSNLPFLSLGSLGDASHSKRAELWTNLVGKHEGSATQALDLYCGDYWSVVRKSLALHPSALSLFIASAGYGFIKSEEKLFPYSATFSRGLSDSITRPQDPAKVNRQWWNHLCNWRRNSGREPSSIYDLALLNPKTPILIALSKEYFAALSDDLLSARNALSDPDLLIIISAGVKKSSDFADNLVPMDASVEHSLGGARGSLNARMLHHLLGVFAPKDFRASTIRPYLNKMLSEQPEIRSFDRARMSDDEVRSFVLSSLEEKPDASFSHLLRQLRDLGKACEYKRFRGLFNSTTTSAQPSNIAA